ncbi:unnamed protein product [Mytilus coruscus]|uniref:Uncharacterized protein n=1 Tax=Mytilus coruscus TaxID=42192 RepID=A0A6J8EJV1_MYTCO|nr:unnamed protein product [Mytilus coruscus]
MKKRRPRLQVMTPEIRKALNEKRKAYYEWKHNDQPNDPVTFLDTVPTKITWKKCMTNKIKTYWHKKILDEKQFSSLQHLSPIYKFGHCHQLVCITTPNPKLTHKLPPRVKIATGEYIPQSHRAKYNSNVVEPTCQMYQKGDETQSHFLLTCKVNEIVRKPMVEKIISTSGRIFPKDYTVNTIELLKLICDPYKYGINYNNRDILDNISKALEPQCRKLIHILHTTRYRLLSYNDGKQ